jgi:REP element-mobilizing transposase RayT
MPRRSNRLKYYDYTQPGAYFITLCTSNRGCLFGEIIENAMVLSRYGTVVCNEWINISHIRSELSIDEWVIMPNHLHGIVWIQRDAWTAGIIPGRPLLARRVLQGGSMGSLIAGFKSAVTSKVNALRYTPDVPVWQRNYYDHIIRNTVSLHNTHSCLGACGARPG